MGCVRAPQRGIYLPVEALHNESAGRKGTRQAEGGVQVQTGFSWRGGGQSEHAGGNLISEKKAAAQVAHLETISTTLM